MEGRPKRSLEAFGSVRSAESWPSALSTKFARSTPGLNPQSRKLGRRGCVRPTCKKAGRHAGLAARDAKNFAADVCGRLPEMQKTLRPMFAVGCPRCKKLGGRCLRSAARDAKNFAADVCGRLPEMQKNFAVDVCGRLPEMQKTWWPMFAAAARDVKTWRPMFAVGCPRCKNLAADVCGRLPEMQKLGGRCLRTAAGDAKTFWPMFAAGCLKRYVCVRL